ncbi:AAA family ATPase [Stutzerimonas frequens]|uniref:AAA family ATPase n=1 Tax=Stutzerimonas frequens TaxID=2968969 RepID=UPI002DB69609|nr:AAA family ATPase [Stutzerimonas frequens]WRW26272.1 AAA family ATPase [Stutzerimonas frequens]
MNKPIIEYFSIYGMHGHKNIQIDFSTPYSILLSENGQGKTTILKIIDATLNGNIKKLREASFDSIEIKFSNAKESVRISKSDLEYEWESRAYAHIRGKVDEEKFAEILEVVTGNSSSKNIIAEVRRLFLSDEMPGASRALPFSTMALRDLIEEKESVALKKQNLGFFKAIKDYFPLNTLYLPTYRRVEDLISSLTDDDDIQGNEHIRFGLSDVKATLESIKKEILTSCNDSITRINGEILSRLVKGLSLTEEDRNLIQENIDSLGLVLNRFGKSLSQEDKELIAAKVSSPADFNDERNEALVYFLSKMYSAFLEQREKDNALGKFAEICSSYFVNKQMTYDETTLEVLITCRDTGNDIEFEQLSSGEKQIVSLFSKLLLEKGQGLFVLFDEPELSLSVEWQRQLLPDVIANGSCEMLLAMTHSPFIISNTIDYASDLKSYFIEPVEVK